MLDIVVSEYVNVYNFFCSLESPYFRSGWSNKMSFYNPKGKDVISIFALLFVDRTVQS